MSPFLFHFQQQHRVMTSSHCFGSGCGMSEKVSNFIIVCPSSVCTLSVNIGGGATLGKEATQPRRLCERTRRRDCVKLESMNAEGTWYEGTRNDWCWKTPDHWSSSSSSTPQAYSWTWHWEHHSPCSNQWNSPVDTTSSDPRRSMVTDGAK